ncbi:GNAT family N-acetyltransferase [Duffyella gerundensis]|uniref:GNAT family N-acetyltransferase n=1 Tax=Duffyella gerundensis TaxID=1619313 RepID=UPI001654A42E|nr:GNAT family N-acetyltransferase [Duffyella gerundensis]
MDITIRGREIDDAAACQRIHSYPEVYQWTLQLPFPTLDSWRKKFERQANDGAPGFVAERDGQVVGEISLFINSNVRIRQTIGFGLVVDPNYGGRGVGQQLVAAAIDYAFNWFGATRLELEAFTDNQRAIRLYERMGFEQEGVRRRAALRESQYRDVTIMARLA